jgi:micrococcal nuclease
MTTLSDLRLKSKLYYYAAYVAEVYDGDTLTVDIDLGLGIWRREQKVRLWKVNTPELRGGERVQGLEVRDAVRALVEHKHVLLRTILDKRGGDRSEKFGRLLGEVLVDDGTGAVVNLNDLLIARGMAIPLDEGGSTVRAVGPRPAATQVECPFCGELRTLDAQGTAGPCPNCLDGPLLLAATPAAKAAQL